MSIIERILSKYDDGKGFQQKELAKAIRCPLTTVNAWFVKSKDPAAKYISGIADFLNVCPLWLLTGRENQQADKCNTSSERDILQAFRTLSPEGQRNVIHHAKSLIDLYPAIEEKKNASHYSEAG